MERRFERLAIVNRGEPALRAIHAVRELAADGAPWLRTIALYTDPDRTAMFVREADEAWPLGSPTFIDPADGGRKVRYLDYEALGRVLREARAEAVWVGWGFVAEHPGFVELCERMGIVFVGPSSQVMRTLGDKIEAKLLAERAGVPVAPWSGGAVESLEEAREHAERIGFPLMVKAAAGGGGRGIRRVEGAGTLPGAFAGARSEALSSFGDPRVLIERLVEPARHVEVQMIADGEGGAWALGTRDCSVQRRHQKVIEESSSPALDRAGEEELEGAATRLVLAAGYRGAATVEFLLDPGGSGFSFMEVNARLQVEHPVTEAVTGADLVKLQLHVAAGGRLEGAPPARRGHAVEARLNAEDPALGFAPAPGKIELLRFPGGPGIRVDGGIAPGDTIPSEFDSMIGKLIAWGADRAEALARLERALGDTAVVIEGGTTNRGFLLELLRRPELRAGEVDTRWLDRLTGGGELDEPRHGELALLLAAIEIDERRGEGERARFFAFARRGRPQAEASLKRAVDLRHRGRSYRLEVAEEGPARFRVEVEDVAVEVGVAFVGEHERILSVGGSDYRALVANLGADLIVEIEGIPHRVSPDDGGLVRNLAPAVVVALPVGPGDVVDAGDVVAVVESMKMESSITAPFRGQVSELLVQPHVHVGPHAPLLRIVPFESSEPADAGSAVAFGTLVGPPREALVRCEAALRRLQWHLLGYDVGPKEATETLAALHAEAGGPCEEHILAGEGRLLHTFADLRALSRPLPDETDPSGALQSPQEHLHAYLASLDAPPGGLPASFTALLERALAHYGIEGLQRSPELERACYRLFLAREREGATRAVVLAILDRRLALADAGANAGDEEFRDVLERVLQASERRDPVVADLAREVRYRCFDAPVIAAARAEVYAEADRHLAALEDDPERADRAAHVRALVDCPRPLAPMIGRRMAGVGAEVRMALLEAMTRRYYRTRELGPFDKRVVGGIEFLHAAYERGGEPHNLFAAWAEPAAIGEAGRQLAACAAEVGGSAVVCDLYAEYTGPAPAPDETAAALESTLGAIRFPDAVRRVVVGIGEPARGRGMSAIDLFTFRPQDGVLREDRSIRGLHPQMAERLHVWRFANFDLEALPSAEDVYLFHARARENPRDERLFACAEVRDLTPVRDEDGELVGVPEFERMLTDALEAIREFQAHRKPSKRLQWNRVLMYAWPVIDLTTEELAALMRRLAPATVGLGIEMALVRGRLRDPATGEAHDRVVRFFSPGGRGVVMEIGEPPREPLRPLDESTKRVVLARRRGLLHPAEVIKLLAPAPSDGAMPRGQPVGEFVEHDLDRDGRLVPVARPPATNEAGVVVGLVSNRTARYPEGMRRVILLGDPTRALGSLAEPECRRIIAALDLAQELGVPLDWFALSAGAKIAMDSGTENMDWIAAVLRRIIEFTQVGGELNVVVMGINVGAQPYWNAEATMLMHTRGILVMTPDSAMVLTGKQALDYSGGVSAEDNIGIGGYERVMGPNGQAQYWAPDVAGACRLLLDHYEHTYVAPGERFPRRAETTDPIDRDIREAPHRAPDSPIARVGEIFSAETNPERKLAFDIRSVMAATADEDHPPLERWARMRDAEASVVWEAHLGGWPVMMIGIESRPLPRFGPIPADGPERWTSGTLFPRSAKKVARAINAAAGRRPVVVLANLAGFDGSPESMRRWQLEFGAEIGRSVVNFDGPIVFCVVSRYHGGAFVVFSQRLNPRLRAVAVEGARASVIGGAPAAAVVFAREVAEAARADPRLAELEERLERAEGPEHVRLRAEHERLWEQVHAEHVGEFAARFDRTHSVERAVRVGSVDEVIEPERVRPFLIEAVERGIEAATLGPPGDERSELADTLRS